MKRSSLTPVFLLSSLLIGCGQSPNNQPQPTLDSQNVTVGTEYGYDIDVNQNGAVNIKGVTLFPVGFYYVPYGQTNTTILNDLTTIKSGGFNTVHIDARDATPAEKTFLTTYQNTASNNGYMYVNIGGLLNENPPCANATSYFTDTDSAGEVYLHKYQRHPSFFSYKLSDDAFTDKASTSHCTSAQLQARANFLNGYIDAGVTPSLDPYAADKKKLLSITGSAVYVPYDQRSSTTFDTTWQHYTSIFKTANVIGIQAHSGFNGGQSSTVYYSVEQAVEVAQSGEDAALTGSRTPKSGLGYRSVWAEPLVLDTEPNSLPTSAPKIAVEAWTSVAAGAKGLLWYAYRDTTGKIPDAYFTSTKKVVADLKLKTTDGTELSNVFLNGTRVAALQNSEAIFGTSWQMPNGKKYLLVVNTLERAASGDETILQFRVSGTSLKVLATTSSPRATTGTGGYGFAPWTDPRGVVMQGTLPAQSATLYELN